MGKGSIDTSGLYNYYGRIAGVACIGPADDLLAVIADAHEVWPAADAWTDGESIVVGDLRRYSGRTWQAIVPHTASSANAPGNTTYWAEYYLALGDPPGISVPEWDPTREAYELGEWVWYAGAIYQPSIRVDQTPYISLGISPILYSPFFLYAPEWEFVQYSPKPAGGQATITAEGRGHLTLCIGNADQAASSVLNAGLTGEDQHPPYRGFVTVILDNWFFGTQRQSAPNMELVLRRRANQVTIEGDLAGLQSGQANGIAAAAEILTSDLCLGLDRELIDSDSFNAAATLLRTIPGMAGLSLLIDQQTSAREIFSRLAQQTDAWVRYRPDLNKIEAGIFTHGATPASYHVITVADLAGRPEFEAGGWDDMKSGASIRFVDRQRAFKDTSLQAQDLRARRILGEPRLLTVDRPWITRTGQARAHAREALRVLGRPQLTATLRVRRERARDIRVGDWVRYDIDLEPGGSTLEQYFRVTEKTLPPFGPVTLECDADETLTPTPYEPPEASIVPTDAVPANIAHAIMVPCPPELTEHQCDFLPLIRRPDASIIRCGIQFTCNTDYFFIGQVEQFAVEATVTGDIEADDLEIDLTIDPQTDQTLLSDNPGEARAAGDFLLLFLCRASAANGPVTQNTGGWPKVEACSIVDISLVSSGTYRFTVLRGRLGTYRRQHQQNYSGGDITVAWIVKKAGLKPVWDPALRDVWYQNFEPSQFYFRLQPGSHRTWRPLADCSDWTESNLLRQHLGYPGIFSFDDGVDSDNYALLIGEAAVGTVSRARSSNVATIVCDADHNLITGSIVNITGLGGTGYNASGVSITKIDATSFTYSNTGGDEGTTPDTGGTVSQWPQEVTVTGNWKSYDQTLVNFSALLIAPDGTETEIAEDAAMTQVFAPTDEVIGWAFTASVDPTGFSPDPNGRIQFILQLRAANAAGRVRRFPYYILCGPT